LKSFDYYIKIRRKKFGFYYNIPDGANDAPYDAKMNAFAIQLFGLKSDNDSRRVFRFLTTAFAAYPHKDYCLMCLKCADQQSLPMMEILKFFIRVIPRPGCALEEHLYIAHRSAVFGGNKPYHNNGALKRHYHITKEEELMQFNIAEVVALRLHPFFHFQSDLIFRELTRITNFLHYYYFMHTNQDLLTNDLVNTMQPLEPRRIKKCWFSKGKSIPP
ncbi:hypothetical protein DOY81_014190, partial [Sarcophaga bullata]